jgi:Cu/Zn superoxide dismutase
MKRLAMISVGVLSAIFLLVGCGGGDSQAEQDHAPHKKSASSANLDLRPEHDSGVSGTVYIKNISGGVIVTLDLSELPKPDTLYLAHIHPGTCAEEVQEEEEGQAQEHGEHHDEGDGHEHGEEIEYPLSQVKSDSEGSGSSTTTLRDTSVEKLFSGEPKHVNVHAAGSGNPPILTCADLEEAG